MAEVRVCQEMFPNKECPEKSGFLMEIALKSNLDILIKNITNDWDFTIIIAGNGEVRVGKSVLAMQIACYVYYEIKYRYKFNPCFDLDRNFVFTGSNLISKGHFLGKNYPYSPLNFDEAGADLEGRKVVTGSTKKVLDYFRECGQYNLFNILVIPEFFDLPRGIAMSRSIFLINVYYTANEKTGKFIRGYFNFYSRPNKKRLFLNGKRDLNYNAAPYDFHGRFYEFYPIPREEYKEMKRNALLERGEDKKDLKIEQRDAAIMVLRDKFKLTMTEIRNLMAIYGAKIGRDTLSVIINGKNLENDNEID